MVQTVAVGLSGGVDSTMAALLLQEQGYRVVGLTMAIYAQGEPPVKAVGNACYGPDEKQDIAAVQAWCDAQKIPLHVLDCAAEYKQVVLGYFKEAYLAGLTPNPCVKCNAEMKFGILLQKALRGGVPFDFFATGHYARVEKRQGRFLLKRGADLKKDQSYFLYRLTQEQLARTLFPLGEYHKTQIREMARARGLAVADKADSQDFYAGDYADLLGTAPRAGKIVHVEGKVLGEHRGFWNYTIGQRKGLGIAAAEPLFVVDIDAAHNVVVVGGAQHTASMQCRLKDVVWGGLFPAPTAEPLPVMVKYRSSGKLVPATIESDGKDVVVRFDAEQRSVARGQSLVFYQNDIVAGGGIIAAH